jgi:hypothetical protein
MHRPAVWLTLLIVLVLALLSPVFAWHTCAKCIGTVNAATDSKFEGTITGGQTLSWRSVQRLEHSPLGPTPEQRCYERSVSNQSVKTIVDVVWDVAAFWKNKIPGRTELCDLMTLPGSLVKPDPVGPLSYGPAKQRIDTQVYAPVIGWPSRTKKAFLSGDAVVLPVPAALPTKLSNGVSFAQATLFDASATMVLISEVQLEGAGFRYSYSVSHDAKDAVQVTWSVVTDREPILDVYKDYALSPNRPVVVPVGKTITFTFTSNDAPTWGIGPVTIRDRSGQALATGSAASYGPRTGTVRDAD